MTDLLQILRRLEAATVKPLSTPFVPLRGKRPHGVPGGGTSWDRKARTGSLLDAKRAARWLAADRDRHALAGVPGWWGVAVLDLDTDATGAPLASPDAICEAFPPAGRIPTESGGLHLVYGKPNRLVKNSIWWFEGAKAGDVRADLTYVKLHDLRAFLEAVEWVRRWPGGRPLPVELCSERLAKPAKKQLGLFG